MSDRTKAWVWLAATGIAVSAGILRADQPAAGERPAVVERFVPRVGTTVCGSGKIEIKSQATSSTKDITLKQLCGWSEADAGAFAPVADLVVDRFDGAESTHVVSMLTIRTVLRQAGTNLGGIQFSGATECVVARGLAIDTADKPAADAAPGAAVVAGTKGASVPRAAAEARAPAPDECTPFHSLKDRLMDDLSQRLNIPVDRLQVSFVGKDANTLNLAEPTFHFDIESRHVHDLGRVTWDVTVMTGNNKEKVTISADTQAWVNELVLSRPVASGQVLVEQDLTDQRALVDQLPMDTILTRAQAVGQQAARPLSPGAVLTGRLIDPVQMARTGQLVTVTLTQGSVQVTTSATALEAGTVGQTIRVRNEETRDVYDVTLTGKQLGVVGSTGAVATVGSN